MAKKKAATKEEAKLRVENALLKHDLDATREQIKVLLDDLERHKKWLTEEDARAEAFEFVLRMMFKYPVVHPPREEKK